MNKKKNRAIRAIGIALFVCYLLLMVYFLFFAENYGRTSLGGGEMHYNLSPLQEIRRFLKYYHQLGMVAVCTNILGNVLAFAPLGFFLPAVLPGIKTARAVILTGFLFSLLVETIQLITRVGVFDVDDLILNTVGTMLGYLGFAVCRRIRRKKYGKKI